jgi:phospholipid/cholesterol/gamma-HCH transport system ATP-binding protein
MIDARGIVNRFGEQVVHDHLDLTIRRGEIVGLVGGSGSGKSVLLRTLIGLHQPDAGRVLIAGRDVRSLTAQDRAQMFGVLFQSGALFSNLTVAQNVMAPIREHFRLSTAQAVDLARLKIALANLPPEAADKYPAELSGGMVKRAALARALALDPPLLFLDEPTSGLDPLAAAEFDQLVQQLNRSLGLTFLLITHDLDTLFGICDRVAVLVDRQITIDRLENLLISDHPWIRQYFHGPRARAAAAGVQHGAE